MTTARRLTGVIGIAAALGGCPALVSDPPYRLVDADAASEMEGAATDAGGANGDGEALSGEAGRELDARSDVLADVEVADAPPADADARAADAGCPGVICNGACLAGVSDCSTCSGMTSLCIATNTCQSTCGGCGNVAITCVLCPGGGQTVTGTPIGCGDGCLTGSYPHCGCSTASGCLMPNQTCTNGMCTTCGEPLTDQQLCFGSCKQQSKSQKCTQSSRACTCM